ncbi:hypothetical protein HMPREF1622_04705 [Escherichia coli A35218R]|nr:hypothetical protein HMPREF1622_04705 [Escherichia coli A35218R]
MIQRVITKAAQAAFFMHNLRTLRSIEPPTQDLIRKPVLTTYKIHKKY